MRILPAILALILAAFPARAQVADASLTTGRKLAPFVISFKPEIQMSPLPGWMMAPASVKPETATVEIPIPALWAAPAVEFYALTVVFDDLGDGGPAVEWHGADGTVTALSTGLGEVGQSLGWNVRTILLPRELTKEGGFVLVSYYGKFSNLISIAVRPAREDLLAVLGARTNPALVDEALRVFEREEVDGRRTAPLTGDVRNGAVVEAELSAAVEEISGEIEFVAPIEGQVEASMLRLEVLGLDPEARLEVRVNGILVGTVGFPPFRLDDPALVPDGLGRLVIAGWRDGSLYLPARLWTTGENTILISIKRSELESGRPVFLKNSSLHIRFGGEFPPSAPAEIPPAEPDLTLPDPLVPNPEDPPLPEIVTGVR